MVGEKRGNQDSCATIHSDDTRDIGSLKPTQSVDKCKHADTGGHGQDVFHHDIGKENSEGVNESGHTSQNHAHEGNLLKNECQSELRRTGGTKQLSATSSQNSASARFNEDGMCEIIEDVPTYELPGVGSKIGEHGITTRTKLLPSYEESVNLSRSGEIDKSVKSPHGDILIQKRQRLVQVGKLDEVRMDEGMVHSMKSPTSEPLQSVDVGETQLNKPSEVVTREQMEKKRLLYGMLFGLKDKLDFETERRTKAEAMVDTLQTDLDREKKARMMAENQVRRLQERVRADSLMEEQSSNTLSISSSDYNTPTTKVAQNGNYSHDKRRSSETDTGSKIPRLFRTNSPKYEKTFEENSAFVNLTPKRMDFQHHQGSTEDDRWKSVKTIRVSAGEPLKETSDEADTQCPRTELIKNFKDTKKLWEERSPFGETTKRRAMSVDETGININPNTPSSKIQVRKKTSQFEKWMTPEPETVQSPTDMKPQVNMFACVITHSFAIYPCVKW